MSKLTNPLFRLLAVVQDRFRRARAGSVLILVVALLVIMALLGTAFISTARIDRYGAAQNAANTQIDLLVEGVKNLVVGQIVGDLFNGANQYRPSGEPEQGSNYEHHDSPLVDLHLASRVPITTPQWRSVSWPLTPNGGATAPYQFDAPNNLAPVSLSTGTYDPAVNYKQEYRFAPSSGPLNGQADFPYLRVFHRPVGGSLTQITTGAGIPAADVDGDGIADAGLWKLPMGPIEGITYFAASRIIDNNSAWNGSTAWQPNVGSAAAPNLPGNFWPSNINLTAMLANATEIDTLNTYRFNDATPTAGLQPVSDAAPSLTQTPTNRTDFEFVNAQEAFWRQLGSRPDHPGYNASGALYQSLPMSDSLALAYRFCLLPPGGATGQIEKLTASYVTGVPTQPYAANAFSAWFTANFDYGLPPFSTFKPLRPITVARNPVANVPASPSITATALPPAALPAGRWGFRGEWTDAAGTTPYNFGDWVTVAPGYAYLCIRPHTPASANAPTATAAQGLYWEKVPWTDQPVKANVNTASFGELWHAFFEVMADPVGGDPTYFAPFNAVSGGVGTRMFRSSARDPSITGPVVLNPWQMMMLRSAIAAVNAMDLRDSDSDVTSRDIVLTNSPTDTTIAYEVTVYGTERNPYITEVMVDTGTPGFIGIELHNPTTIPLDLSGWRLGAIDRTAAGPRPRVIADLLAGIDLGTVVAGSLGTPLIAPGDYIVLFDGVAPDITPTLIASGKAVQVPSMAQVPPLGGFNREIVLLRTRNSSGAPSIALSKPGDSHDEVSNINLADLVPVDQIDLTGIQPGVVGTAPRVAYRRPSLVPATPSTAWNFTNAGAYNLVPVLGFYRHVGMIPTPGDPGNLGFGDTRSGIAPLTTAGTYPTRPMQIANLDMGGPNKTYLQTSGPTQWNQPTGEPNHFPFGGFARNGDILQVPFVGAYTIRVPGDPRDSAVQEMNSLPMDAAFADDEDTTNDPTTTDTGAVTEIREEIGRFCPVGNPQAAAGSRGDYEPTPATTDPNYATIINGYRYQWAMDLFDHLTVESPSDDLLPNVDPAPIDTLMTPNAPAKYPGATPPALVANQVQTLANANSLPPGTSEGKAPIEGLINLNTASAKVLSALPMVLTTTGAIDTGPNAQLAQYIVDWRDGPANGSADPNGPFRTLFDLYKVPEFAAAQLLVLNNAEPDDFDGDLSPLGTGATGTDTVRFDFEERFLLMNRISNMVTTRSDSYTVYLLVQGWQDAGTANPTLRTQRRLAFIVDRSRITPTSPTVVPLPIPNN